MYPDLSYLFHDLFGTSVDNWTSVFKTFGLMLALAFVACAWLLKSELKRLEEEGKLTPGKKTVTVKDGIQWNSIASNTLLMFLAGAKLPYIFQNFSAFQQDPASVLFSGSGSWGIGILLAIGTVILSYYLDKNEDRKPGTYQVIQHPHEHTGNIIILAAVSGVLGSRLFSILENLPAFFRDPMGQLLSGSGLTVYGGIILASITLIWYVRKHNIKTVYMMDIGGMGILLGYAIGRIGCQLSGDGDWGIVAAAQPEWWFLPEWLWSYTFPNNVSNAGVLLSDCDVSAFNETLNNRQLAIEQRCQISCGMRYCHELKEGVYPTSVYETIISLLFLAILWIYRKKIKIAGMLFAIYLIMNGVERFFIEEIRVNEKYDFLGLHWSQAQYISVLFILLGITGIIYLKKKSPGKVD